MKRPNVNLDCVAGHYGDKQRERIVEFSFPGATGNPGGLISFYNADDGPRVDIYNVDSSITILAPQRAADKGDTIKADLLAALRNLVAWMDASGLSATKPGGVGPFAYGPTEYSVVTEARAAIAKAEGGAA